MKVVLQRVSDCSVVVDQKTIANINFGLLILLGIHTNDTEEDIEYLTQKINKIRIFDDQNGVMNISPLEAGAEIVVVSQFTLYADTKKGNRPSYINAARPEIAIPLYKKFIEKLKTLGYHVETGEFGADMKLRFTNEGPVTIIIDTLNK